VDASRISEILDDPVTLDLVERQPIMQIAYAAADGSPRAVPVGYLLRGGKFLFFTIPTSDKVAALHRDPRVALTVDVYPPPCCLLVRGTAELREEAGVPDEYLEASFRTMPADQHAGFEQQVRALYDSMVRVEISPTWVRLNDFQRTAPRAVERLVQAKQG
jgi:hypothetical protein